MVKDNQTLIDKSVKDKYRNSKFFKYATGIIASTAHYVMIIIIIFITIFSFNIKLLTITMIIIVGLMIVNIAVHNCPLTEIENEVWGDNIINMFNRIMPINYSSGRQYEVQLQYIFICSAIIPIKILFYYVRDDIKNYFNIKYT